MIEFRDLMALAVNRKGGVKQVEAQLPAVKTPAQLRKPDDAFYFSAMTRRIFRAGLTHALVDARWPAFEEAFFGFDPEKLVLMPDTMLEDRMQDTRLIRHWGKMKAIRHNARLVLDLRRKNLEFTVNMYKEQKDVFILGGMDDVLAVLEETQVFVGCRLGLGLRLG